MPNSTTNYEPLSTIRVIFNRAGGKLVFDYCQGDKWLITSDVIIRNKTNPRATGVLILLSTNDKPSVKLSKCDVRMIDRAEGRCAR
jgi:hypothetical protein